MQTLANRIALVTHASSPQGRAIVSALEQAGARVAPLDETDAALTPAEQIARAVAPFGRLDILVTVPVMPAAAPAETMPLSQFKQTLADNLNTVFFWCQAAAEQMRNQVPNGGCIINLSSVGGVVALPGQSAFSAAMAGVNSITQVLAVEWQPYGVRVVGVGAGLTGEQVETQILPTVLPDGVSAGHRRMPAHTLTPPSDVVDTIVFLASDAARHINGTTVYADGGWLADGYWE